MNITLPAMTVGGPSTKVHLKAFAADQVHNPSQILDTTSPLNFSAVSGGGAVNCAVDPNDNRAVIFTPVAAGTAVIHVDKFPASPGGSVNYTIPVNPAFVDNSRVDHLSIDP